MARTVNLGGLWLFPGCVPEEPPPRKPLIKPGAEQAAREIRHSLLLLLFIEEGQFYESELDPSKSFLKTCFVKCIFRFHHKILQAGLRGSVVALVLLSRVLEAPDCWGH